MKKITVFLLALLMFQGTNIKAQMTDVDVVNFTAILKSLGSEKKRALVSPVRRRAM